MIHTRQRCGLTYGEALPHTFTVLDASKIWRGNQRFTLGALAPTIGRYFFARCITMAAWAGQASAWPVPRVRYFHPRSSRRHTAVESGRVGSIRHSRSHP
jgi:hypothetical protein